MGTEMLSNEEIVDLDRCTGEVHNRAELICSIRVPQNSDAAKKRTQFMKQYNELCEFIESQKNLVEASIKGSKALSTMQY